MQGRVLSHYRIAEEIGSGAVGVVYRAHDLHLERAVAVKVLAGASCPDEATRRRFRREALALSQLDHPNVATVYDFDTQDGVDFLVMELIDGPTLQDRIGKGPLPEPEVLGLGRQIAEGLRSAHEKGVVHRDLKPANVLIRPDGRLKVVDFGLASLRRTAADADRTVSAEDVAGTPFYLAPEVLEGASADERSDIYALGVMLYEMATGRRPFEGPTAMQVIYAVANESPPSPGTLNPGLSRGLLHIIEKAMSRDPAGRYQSAARFIAALDEAARGSTPAADPRGDRIRALAVLPLENLSGDPGQEFFADGMTEALIANLVKLQGTRVISRTSAMAYKGVRKPLPVIARELDVDAVVEGSVARSGERVRIHAQLIHARTDTPLWAESYEQEMADVLTLQREVAGAVAREIRGRLSPEAPAGSRGGRAVKPEAYEAYLRGRFHWNRRTEDALRQGIEHFNRAIAVDPSYALAHVGLADSYNILGFYSYLPSAEAFPRAKAAALEALRMDESLIEAHVSLAYATHFYDWNWSEAERLYRVAVDRIPNYALGHHWYFNFLVSMGRLDEAEMEARKALELDPLSLVVSSGLGWVHFHQRDYDRAIEACERTIRMDRTFAMAWLWSAFAHQAKGDHGKAVDAFREADLHAGRTPLTGVFLAQGLARSGRSEEALRRLRSLEGERRHLPAYVVSLVHLGLGDRERALDWLERAYRQRSHWLVFLGVDPRMDNLRSDRRFQDLLRRLELGG